MTTQTFQIRDYRQDSLVATVTLTDGVWSSDDPVGQDMIESATHNFRNDEDRVKYFSTWTNQVLASRQVK